MIYCNPIQFAVFELYVARYERIAARPPNLEDWSKEDWRDEAEVLNNRLVERDRDYREYRDLYFETRKKLARKRLKHRNTEMTLAAYKKRLK